MGLVQCMQLGDVGRHEEKDNDMALWQSQKLWKNWVELQLCKKEQWKR